MFNIISGLQNTNANDNELMFYTHQIGILKAGQ